jgi:hypothetical protein
MKKFFAATPFGCTIKREPERTMGAEDAARSPQENALNEEGSDEKGFCQEGHDNEGFCQEGRDEEGGAAFSFCYR